MSDVDEVIKVANAIQIQEREIALKQIEALREKTEREFNEALQAEQRKKELQEAVKKAREREFVANNLKDVGHSELYPFYVDKRFANGYDWYTFDIPGYIPLYIRFVQFDNVPNSLVMKISLSEGLDRKAYANLGEALLNAKRS